MSSRTISDLSLTIAPFVLFGVFCAPQYAQPQTPQPAIISRVPIPLSQSFVEFLGGRQRWERRTWSYLAFVDQERKSVEVGPSFPDISFERLAQVEGRHFWALGSTTVEGAKSWVILAISKDSGKSWKVIELDEVFDRAARQAKSRLHVQNILSIDFRTPNNGTMLLRLEESGRMVSLITADGGFHWKVKE